MRLPAYSGPFQVGCIDFEIPVRKPRSFATDILSPEMINKPRKRAKKGDRSASTPPSTEKSEQKNGDQPGKTKDKGKGLVRKSSGAVGRDSRRFKPYTPEQLLVQQARRNKGGARKTEAEPPNDEASETVDESNHESPADSNGGKDDIHDDDQDQYEDLSDWNPFSTGSKTATLHLETVLFTIYYPSSYDPSKSTARETSTTYETLSRTDARKKQQGEQQKDDAAEQEIDKIKRRYSHVAWVGRPKRASLAALASYVGQYGYMALPASPAIFSLMSASLPALVGPPLAEPGDERLEHAAVFPTLRDAKGDKKGEHARQKRHERAQEADGSSSAGAGLFGTLSRWAKKSGASTPEESEVTKEASTGEPDAAQVDRVWSGNHDGKRFPVVIFSHGLAGSRLSYSQYCGELASHGVVVVALEHRDGSGIQTTVRIAGIGAKTAQRNAKVAKRRQHEASRVTHSKGKKTQIDELKRHAQLDTQSDRDWEHEDEDSVTSEDVRRAAEEYRRHSQQLKQVKRGQRYGTGFGRGPAQMRKVGLQQFNPLKASVPYLTFERFNMRSFATNPTKEEDGLRQAQISMRIAEIEECKHILGRLNAGEGYQLYLESTRGLGSKLAEKRGRTPPRDSIIADPEPQLSRWKDQLDMDYPLLVGHSFGGCTVAQTQRTISPPFPAAILLDPWCEPLPLKSPNPIVAPLAVINSESFSIWKENFAKLKQICHDAREANPEHQGWLMTLCGSAHLDFSDLPLILPHLFRSVVGPQATISIFFQATFTQMGLWRSRFREQAAAASEPPTNEDKDGSKRPDIGRLRMPSRRATNLRQPTSIMTPAKEYPGIGFASEAAPVSQTKQPQVASLGDAFDVLPRQHVSSPVKEHDFASLTVADGPKEETREAKEEKEKPVRPKLGGSLAHRTPSGNLVGERRPTDTSVDFMEPEDYLRVDDADQDAAEVLRHVQSLSDRLSYKRPDKIHSLLAAVMHAQGIRPGISTPGRILVHQLDRPTKSS